MTILPARVIICRVAFIIVLSIRVVVVVPTGDFRACMTKTSSLVRFFLWFRVLLVWCVVCSPSRKGTTKLTCFGPGWLPCFYVDEVLACTWVKSLLTAWACPLAYGGLAEIFLRCSRTATITIFFSRAFPSTTTPRHVDLLMAGFWLVGLGLNPPGWSGGRR